MTGRELLIMYARLRGVPETDIYKYVEAFIFSLHLETHADEFVSKYRWDMLFQLLSLTIYKSIYSAKNVSGLCNQYDASLTQRQNCEKKM